MGTPNAKLSLYQRVDAAREQMGLGIAPCQYPIDLLEVCARQGNIAVGLMGFKDRGLRGVAHIAEQANENHVIIVNEALTAEERNFYCGHELYHILLHAQEKNKTFNCYDQVKPCQNGFLEWQANEAAAETLIPYRVLLPKIKEEFANLCCWEDVASFKFCCSLAFQVPEITLQYRLESLKYEIWQYLNGTPLEDVVFLSERVQRASGIQVDSLNDIEDKFYRRII